MKLQTNPDNPRTISKDRYEKLKASIERNPDGLTANKIAHKDGIIYGNPSIPNIAESYDLTNGQVYELRRVALNGKQTLPTSKYVALSLKLLRKQKPLVKLIVSYADTAQNHTGTIYRATNWLYLGLMKGSKELKHKTTGKVIHSKSLHNKDRNDYAYIPTGDKHKYVYPFDKQLRSELESKAISYQEIETSAILS